MKIQQKENNQYLYNENKWIINEFVKYGKNKGDSWFYNNKRMNILN